MKKTSFTKLLASAAILTGTLFSGHAFAVGTLAGTEIINNATATFGPSGSSTIVNAAPASFNVDEVINVNLTALDSGNNVDVNSGDASTVQNYQLSNLGNGNEAFVLTQTSTGDFNPDSTSIYYEPVVGGNGVFDGTESLYTTGSALDLDPDQEYYIYVVSSIPAGANVGDSSSITLDATAQTPGVNGANTGDVLTGAGTNGTDAVVATNGGSSSGSSTYTVVAAPNAVVNIVKTIDSVTADVNGTTVTGKYIPGATVTYLISVEVVSGTAEALNIIDTLPTDVTYVANSLEQKIEGAAVFTSVPAASGGYDSLTNQVSVQFGNRGVGTYEIMLDATIN